MITVKPQQTLWREQEMDKLKNLLAMRPELAERAKTPVDWDAVNADAQREYLEEKSARLLRRLPRRYREATLRTEMGAEWLRKYWANEPVNLVLLGEGRLGKTWEACALAVQLLNAYVPVTFLDVPGVLDSLKPNQDMASLESYQLTPVLILDDLGAEKLTEWGQEQLYRLINFRHNEFLPIIVTSNLSTEDLKARYGTRLYPRLTETALMHTLA